MSPRFEVFCSIDPEDGREFVAVLTWLRTNKDGTLTPLTHSNFYGQTAREARANAEGWLAREQQKEADRIAAVQRRKEAREKGRHSEAA